MSKKKPQTVYTNNIIDFQEHKIRIVLELMMTHHQCPKDFILPVITALTDANPLVPIDELIGSASIYVALKSISEGRV